MKLSRQERATAIAGAISRFEQEATLKEHDRRLVAENLGTEAGFGGSPASRRQQVQQYFKEFPDLKRRWKKLTEADAESPTPERDQATDLATVRSEAALLRSQVDALTRVADLHRRKSERLQRQLDQQRSRTEHAAAPASSPTEEGAVVPFARPLLRQE